MTGGTRLIILGTSGTAIDVLDLIQDIEAAGGPSFECVGFLDDNRALWGSTLQGVPVRGPLSAAPGFDDCMFVNGIGSPGNFWRKDAILAGTGLSPDRFVTLLHPTAVVSRSARLGSDVVLFPHVTIGSNARVGHHVVILPGSIVSHDAVIGDYTSIAAGVAISGAARVGRSCYLGTASSLIGGIEIGDGSLVGMGSVVLRAVSPNTVVAGNPARFLRHAVPIAETARV
jgi:sugar O-acyltransferase (sialic acid O-acetyltransferase NeuD family)